MFSAKFLVLAPFLLYRAFTYSRNPLKTINELPTVHATLTSTRSAQLELRIARGEREHFLWPLHLLGLYLAILYLLAPPSWDRWRIYRLARFPVFAANVVVCVRAVTRARSHNPPVQYGIGLITSFACLWLAVHLIWRDTRRDGRRIIWSEMRKKGAGKRLSDKDQDDTSETASGQQRPAISSTSTSSITGVNGDVSRRMKNSSKVSLNGSAGSNAREHSEDMMTSDTQNIDNSDAETCVEYYWQALPESFAERLDWVCTMLLSLRGEGINYGIAQLPAPPASVRASLARNSPEVAEPRWISETKPRPLAVETSRSATVRHYLRVWALTYLILDIAKQLMLRDAYFTGFEPIDSPLGVLYPKVISSVTTDISSHHRSYTVISPYPLLSNPIFAKSMRLLLCISGILALLTNLTALPPLLFFGLLRARNRPWLYPTMFGHQSARDRGWGYVTALRHGGIAGWWGRWWHQMFRLSFEAPAAVLCGWLRLEPRSAPGKAVAMAVAFSLSAALHAAGSATLNGPTRPWQGSGAFFLVQPVGIVIELTARSLLQRIFGSTRGNSERETNNRTRKWLATAAALVWVHAWFYVTAPLLADDVAAGGVWTTEVVPVSLVSLVLGRSDWLRWGMWMMPRWYSDPRVWWWSGIAF